MATAPPSSSPSSPSSWPETLQALTVRASQEKGIKQFKQAKTLAQKLEAVKETPGVTRRITSWISHCSENKYYKSGSAATKLRDEGNAKFAMRDNKGALRLYSEVIKS